MTSPEAEWEHGRWDPNALKRYKSTFKEKGVVVPALRRHVMRGAAEDDPDRDPHILHPSDIVEEDWCPRHDFYRIIGTERERRGNNPSFNMENAYLAGHAIHDKYQSWLHEMGVLWGTWRCLECMGKFDALSPDECFLCGGSRLKYLEVHLSRPPYHVLGHADGALHDLDGFTGLVEIKSIGIGTVRVYAPRMYQRYEDGNETLDTLWMKINRPFPSHMRQGQLYLWLAWPRYEKIVFIYESKFNQQVKEFVISYNPSLIEHLIAGIAAVTQAVDTGVPPDRPTWAVDMMVKRCQGCHYRDTCWSSDAIEEATPAAPKQEVRVKRADARKRRAALSPS